MNLSLIKKPSCEIITLEETKTYLRIDHDFDDNLILNFIVSTREAMESIIQRSIMKQTWEYELNNSSLCNLSFGDSDLPSILGDMIRITLPKPPVMRIISVKVDDKSVDTYKYSLEKINNKFYLYLKAKNILNIRKFSVVITYEAGISENVINIPYQLKLSNLMLVANAYNERFSNKHGSIISEGVKQLLGPFLTFKI
ncbi:MAG: head-tail connector protein [Holosporaceae bacterium]|jgi:hypothetical protein|nr:head-tail connector protein [Holosporaceae bacterium]